MGLKCGKAPAIDGLPADLSGQSLVETSAMSSDTLASGCLPLSCRTVIMLLPKKGDLQQLKNWRPVSAVYRLQVVVKRIGYKAGDQSYCVPGRLITDNVMLIQDFLEVSGSLGVETVLISIDQEKALVVSSARVNWGKSEALAVGEGVATGFKLPGGLVWKRGGIKYLGVFVGNKDYMKRNWENDLEIVEGRVRKLRWIFPKLSYKGWVLVLNNLVSSMLWHRLTCAPPDLLPYYSKYFYY